MSRAMESATLSTRSALDLRVILVGRTGLDAKLRLDPGIELIRSRTPLDAMGELADPIDDESPSRAVVVVSAEAEPDEPHALAEFVDGLRVIDPEVCVLRVGVAGEAAPRPYDGQLDREATGEHVRQALRRAAPSTPPSHASPPASTEDSASAAHTQAQSVGRPRAEVRSGAGLGMAGSPSDGPAAGDEQLVEALLRGRDPLPEAMAVVRARVGSPDVRFVSEHEPKPHEAVAVRWKGRVYGWLASESCDPMRLAPHSAWLAAWIRLGEQQHDLREAAFTDPLTGAWNRRYFDRFLDAAIDQALKARLSLTVLVFDIDDFKQYNDRYGHAAGDEILAETVRLLRSVIRPSDRVCRIGGDEFAVIFHEPEGPRDPSSRPPESIYDIAQRFQQQICNHRFPKLAEDAPGTLTISGGLATYPWDGRNAEELLERADQLALESKTAGKNAITMGPGAMRVCGRGSPRGEGPALG